MEYDPDKWVILKITNPEDDTHYRVFCTWYGGYLYGNSWRLNSGITSSELKDGCYKFSGTSGSTYFCNKQSYGTSEYGNSVLGDIIDEQQSVGIDVTVLPEETDWLTVDWTPNE